MNEWKLAVHRETEARIVIQTYEHCRGKLHGTFAKATHTRD